MFEETHILSVWQTVSKGATPSSPLQNSMQ